MTGVTLHTGQSYTLVEVRIGPSNIALIEHASKAADIATPVAHWLAATQSHDNIYYFAIFLDQMSVPIGQILLHDMDRRRESLIAYHLFQPQLRGRGVGTKALHLLQQFVVSETSLTKLIIITSRDNVASQTIAQKCGFTCAGAPREDPEHGMVFMWDVPRSVSAVHTQ